MRPVEHELALATVSRGRFGVDVPSGHRTSRMLRSPARSAIDSTDDTPRDHTSGFSDDEIIPRGAIAEHSSKPRHAHGNTWVDHELRAAEPNPRIDSSRRDTSTR